MQNFKDKLETYIKNGWAVIPIKIWYNPEADKIVKSPAIKEWKKYQTTLPTMEDFKYCDFDKINAIALVTGSISGIFVLDDDERGVKKNISPIQNQTMNNGQHYFFQMEDRLKEFKIGTCNEKDKKNKWTYDWRGEGGYVVLEGEFENKKYTPNFDLNQLDVSTLPLLPQRHYEYLKNRTPEDKVKPVSLPELFSGFKNIEDIRTFKDNKPVYKPLQDGRDYAMYRLAMNLVGSFHTYGKPGNIKAQMLKANEVWGFRHSERELAHKFNSANEEYQRIGCPLLDWERNEKPAADIELDGIEVGAELLEIQTESLQNPVSYGLSGLDQRLRGIPLASSDLLFGPEKVGKTTYAVHLAMTAVLAGKNVTYYAFEDIASSLRQFYCWISNKTYNPEEVLSKIEVNQTVKQYKNLNICGSTQNKISLSGDELLKKIELDIEKPEGEIFILDNLYSLIDTSLDYGKQAQKIKQIIARVQANGKYFLIISHKRHGKMDSKEKNAGILGTKDTARACSRVFYIAASDINPSERCIFLTADRVTGQSEFYSPFFYYQGRMIDKDDYPEAILQQSGLI